MIICICMYVLMYLFILLVVYVMCIDMCMYIYIYIYTHYDDNNMHACICLYVVRRPGGPAAAPSGSAAQLLPVIC